MALKPHSVSTFAAKVIPMTSMCETNDACSQYGHDRRRQDHAAQCGQRRDGHRERGFPLLGAHARVAGTSILRGQRAHADGNGGDRDRPERRFQPQRLAVKEVQQHKDGDVAESCGPRDRRGSGRRWRRECTRVRTVAAQQARCPRTGSAAFWRMAFRLAPGSRVRLDLDIRIVQQVQEGLLCSAR
jgi:hypothetical protein